MATKPGFWEQKLFWWNSSVCHILEARCAGAAAEIFSWRRHFRSLSQSSSELFQSPASSIYCSVVLFYHGLLLTSGFVDLELLMFSLCTFIQLSHERVGSWVPALITGHSSLPCVSRVRSCGQESSLCWKHWRRCLSDPSESDSEHHPTLHFLRWI